MLIPNKIPKILYCVCSLHQNDRSSIEIFNSKVDLENFDSDIMCSSVFTVHSLGVVGIHFYIGVPIGVRAQLVSHKSVRLFTLPYRTCACAYEQI